MTTKMLPLVLVFLFARSAFALPYENVDFYAVTNDGNFPDNGQLINRNVTLGALGYIDGGDTPLYAQILVTPMLDLSASVDASSQAIAAIQVISYIGALANGIPGDACQPAALINTIANGGNVCSAVTNYIRYVNNNIDNIVQLVVNPKGARFSAGPQGGCVGGGRNYAFNEIWDVIINDANVFQAGLLNEEFCAAKRLYTSSDIRGNVIAATVTASTTPQVVKVTLSALDTVGNFLRALADGRSPIQSAAALKGRLIRGLRAIEC